MGFGRSRLIWNVLFQPINWLVIERIDILRQFHASGSQQLNHESIISKNLQNDWWSFEFHIFSNTKSLLQSARLFSVPHKNLRNKCKEPCGDMSLFSGISIFRLSCVVFNKSSSDENVTWGMSGTDSKGSPSPI